MAERALDELGSTEAPPHDLGDMASAQDRIEQLTAALARSEAREQALRHELQHRVRNMLGVLRSVFRKSRETSPSQESFAAHFEGRLNALARYQSHFVGRMPSAFDLEDIIRDELLDTRCLDGPRCSIRGPVVALDQKPAELIGLAIHELATNAIKFGALAQGGSLAISWSVGTGHAGHWLALRWEEAGVSVTGEAPRPAGFGRELIEEALPYQLGAETSFNLRPGGLVCVIAIPLPDTGSPDEPNELAPDHRPLLSTEKE